MRKSCMITMTTEADALQALADLRVVTSIITGPSYIEIPTRK